MDSYLNIMIAAALSYFPLMRAAFIPTLLQSATACVYEPLRYIDILIRSCGGDCW